MVEHVVSGQHKPSRHKKKKRAFKKKARAIWIRGKREDEIEDRYRRKEGDGR